MGLKIKTMTLTSSSHDEDQGLYKLDSSALQTRDLAFCDVMFCSFAVLNPRVGHTRDALSPFISVLLSF